MLCNATHRIASQKTKTGSALFKFFSALKTVVQSGPVDQLTLNSKYSLSEEHLLRWHNASATAAAKDTRFDSSDTDSSKQAPELLQEAPYREIVRNAIAHLFRQVQVPKGSSFAYTVHYLIIFAIE